MHSSTNPPVTREAYFGGGCFWCLEAMFEKVRGVVDVTNGYAGGQTPDPTYQEVCSDRTGHAEVVRITYDPRKITYDQLLDLFWQSHDPTTVDRQGADVGSQYRSIILTTTDEEQRLAEAAIRTVNASGRFPRPVVTEVKPLDRFYPAEDYHQDYFQKHPDVPYCVFVIQPKLEKFEHASGAKNLIQK
ncbi:MAG: peptide-methionine (S)-S-oxide reductase [Candidatus Neomarinimicrobiota bacterium]|nr:MAG: peptide-methionine (S)-S-oxide reductase [Candidatus Neomarinimicrobiota bacterium]